MKDILSFFSFVIILLSPLISSASLSIEAKELSEPVLIATYEDDITGDGFKEIIELKGRFFSQDSKYYHEIWADITNVDMKKWRISYQGGYEPSIQLIDVNHDHITDLLFQSSADGSGELNNNQLHTLKNGEITHINLAKQLYTKGKFTNDFEVMIQISPNHSPISVNVIDQEERYLQLGIYNQQGKLLKPTSVKINPSARFEPILIDKKNGYGLKSYQQISGAYQTDELGTIETLWYYENSDWIILQTNWVPNR